MSHPDTSSKEFLSYQGRLSCRNDILRGKELLGLLRGQIGDLKHRHVVFQVNGSSDCVTAPQLPSLSKVWGESWSPPKRIEMHSNTIKFLLTCMLVLGSRSVMLSLEMNVAG